MNQKQQVIKFLIENNGKPEGLTWLNVADMFGYKLDKDDNKRAKAANDLWRAHLKKKTHSPLDTMTVTKAWQNARGDWLYSCKVDNEVDIQEYRSSLIEEIKNYSPAVPEHDTVLPSVNDCALEISIPDLHVGRGSALEAKQMFLGCISRLFSIANSYSTIKRVILPIGNDFFNTDTIDYKTTRGTQQFDSENWMVTFREGWKMLVEAITWLSSHAQVYVIVVPGNHDRCYSEDTEVLTKDGWISYDKIAQDTKIATINPISKETEYQEPIDIYINKYNGIMHKYSSRYMNSLVTPNHRMLLRLPHEDQYKFIKSKDFNPTGYERFRLTGENYKSDYLIEDDWLRLFAWINSDGSIDKRGNILIYQVEGKKLDRIRGILQRLDIGYHEYFRIKKVKAIAGKELINHTNKHWVLTLNKKHAKDKLDFIRQHIADKYKLPEILHNCSKRQVEIYINEYILGDGHQKDDSNHFAIYGKKNMLNQLQHLLVINGYYAKIHYNEKRNNYVLFSHKRENAIVNRNYKTEEIYNGNIWCVEVPNGNLITRRNGVVNIHGNSKMFYVGDVVDAWFHNNDNVIVNNNMHPFKFHHYGNNLIMYEHGELKTQDYPLIMATEVPRLFAETKYREVHCGHFHKEMLNEFRGVKVRYLPSIAPNSQWEKKSGYKHLRAAQGLVWHQRDGLVSIHQINVD